MKSKRTEIMNAKLLGKLIKNIPNVPITWK